GLVYALILVAAFCWARFIQPSMTGRPRPTGVRVGLVAGAVVVAAGLAAAFWYGRNLVETGNPVGVARVRVAGITLFDGPLDSERSAATSLWRQFRFGNAADWRILLGQMRKELGSLFIVSVLGACVASWFGAAASAPRPRLERALLAGLVVATGIAYWTTP